MRYDWMSRGAWLVVGAAALGVAGCATEQQTSSNTGTVSGRTAAPDDTSARAGARGRQPMVLYFPTGRADSSVIMLAVQTPDQVRVGQPYTYEVQVRNLTDAPLTSVTIHEVSHGMDAQAMTPEQADRRGSAQEEPTARPADARQPGPRQRQAGSRQDTWELGRLDPRQTKTVRIEATEEQEGMAHHCFTVDFNPVACTMVAVVNPQLRLTKVGPDHALICQDLPFRYRVENVGTGTARGVRVVEPLPEGLTTTNGQNSVTFDAGDLAAGQAREFTANFRANRTGEFTTRPVVASADGESPSKPMTTVVGEPALEVAIHGPDWEYLGKPVAYEVSVTNRGNAPAPNARVSIEGAALDGGAAARDLGTIPPGETRRVTINATPSRAAAANAAPGTPMIVQVGATATAECAKPSTELARTEIRTISALLLECVDTNDPVRIGDTTSYQVVVKNQGSGPAKNIALRASLPPEMEFIGASGATPIRVDGKTLIFAPVANLPAGQSATWTINARALNEASVQFQLEMKADDQKDAALESEPTTLYK